jgi:hypothetical protein
MTGCTQRQSAMAAHFPLAFLFRQSLQATLWCVVKIKFPIPWVKAPMPKSMTDGGWLEEGGSDIVRGAFRQGVAAGQSETVPTPRQTRRFNGGTLKSQR